MVHPTSWRHAALVALASLALIVAGCDLAAPLASAPTEPPATPAPTGTGTATAAPSPGGGALPPAPEGLTQEAVVTNVVDGDTIEVEIEGEPFTVSYIGIDAPELGAESGQDEPLARQAQAANRGLVGEQSVLLEQDVSEVDEFGNLLRYVWVDVNGTLRMVNHILLARGFGELATVSPDIRYDEAFQVAEAAARERGAGIWASDAAEPSPTPEPTPTPAPVVEEEEVPIGAGQTAFRGGAGSYRWTAITFTSVNNFAIRWSATSTSGACEMEWSLVGANSAFGSAKRSEPGQADGRKALVAPVAGPSELRVESNCRKWLITFNEIVPPPTPEPTPESTNDSAEPTEEATPAPSA